MEGLFPPFCLIRNKMITCPCGIDVEEGIDYFDKEIYDLEGNVIGIICIHGEFISYGE